MSITGLVRYAVETLGGFRQGDTRETRGYGSLNPRGSRQLPVGRHDIGGEKWVPAQSPEEVGPGSLWSTIDGGRAGAALRILVRSTGQKVSEMGNDMGVLGEVAEDIL